MALEDAYQVQDSIMAGAEVGGWKISRARPGSSHEFESAPVLAQDISPSPADFALADCSYVECEIALVIGRDADPAAFPSREAVLGLIAECRVALEILHTRWTGGLGAAPQYGVLADCAANAGVVLGDRVPSGLIDPPGQLHGYLTTSQDGSPSDRKSAKHDPVQMLAGLVQSLHQRGHRLRKGQIVITGAIDFAPAKPELMTGIVADQYRSSARFRTS